jgi:hypothetical protein
MNREKKDKSKERNKQIKNEIVKIEYVHIGKKE